jgi:hypothetical protein
LTRLRPKASPRSSLRYDKKIFKSAGLGVQVAARLIDFLNRGLMRFFWFDGLGELGVEL